MTGAEPLLYLAGPYAKPDPVENTHATIHMADRIMADGFAVPVVPHLSMLWHAVSPHPAEFWYAYDLRILERCDGLLRLPGESIGADAEVAHAAILRLPVFYDYGHELRDWALRVGQATKRPGGFSA